MTVADSFKYDPQAPDFDGEAARVKAEDPDAIALMGFTDSASVLRAMIEQRLGRGTTDCSLQTLPASQVSGAMVGGPMDMRLDGDGAEAQSGDAGSTARGSGGHQWSEDS